MRNHLSELEMTCRPPGQAPSMQKPSHHVSPALKEEEAVNMSSDESCGSSSDYYSVLWTEEFDEELE